MGGWERHIHTHAGGSIGYQIKTGSINFKKKKMEKKKKNTMGLLLLSMGGWDGYRKKNLNISYEHERVG